mmetsp:Transcript_2909/g.10385  ORF Transcript_2909/g.10385 Transcript_2909/m.10385 type:complete len:209 (+) Transcript_2909:228-854(+)
MLSVHASSTVQSVLFSPLSKRSDKLCACARANSRRSPSQSIMPPLHLKDMASSRWSMYSLTEGSTRTKSNAKAGCPTATVVAAKNDAVARRICASYVSSSFHINRSFNFPILLFISLSSSLLLLLLFVVVVVVVVSRSNQRATSSKLLNPPVVLAMQHIDWLAIDIARFRAVVDSFSRVESSSFFVVRYRFSSLEALLVFVKVSLFSF